MTVTKWKVVYSLLVLLSFYLQGQLAVVFECGLGQSWPVKYEDNENLTILFQTWLTTFQFNATKCQKYGPYEDSFDIISGGLGASYALHAMRDMLIAMPSNRVFRPPVGFLWADSTNTSQCSNHWPSFDCYLRSYSSCLPTTKISRNMNFSFEADFEELHDDVGKWKHKSKKQHNHNQRLDNITILPVSTTTKLDVPWPEGYTNQTLSSIDYLRLSNALGESPDLCTIAKYAEKPIQWVMGQILHYLTRPSARIQERVNQRVNEVLAQVPNGTAWLAVHVRTGKPDQDRKLISWQKYLSSIDNIVSEYSAVNTNTKKPPITFVYLASQSNSETFKNVSYWNHLYPRHFQWYFLPNYIVPNSSNLEIEVILRHNPANITISREDLTVDFLVDLELFARADFFLGSKSTIYLAATLLRFARKYGTVETSTCMLFSEDLYCEGTMDIIKKIWRWYYTFGKAFYGGSYRKIRK